MADITAVLKKKGENLYPYLMYKPKNYADRNDWPVVIQFHGAGDGGDGSEASMRTTLLKNTTWLKLANDGVKEFDCIIIAPQVTTKTSSGEWNFNTEMVCGFKMDGTQSDKAPYSYDNLLSHILRTYAGKIDVNRVHVNGYSAGGRVAMQVISAVPQIIASCLAACPAIDVNYPTDRAIDKPIRVFQNSWDKTVSDINITNVSMRLKEINTIKQNILLTMKESDSHDAWTAMYKDMANYNWQLSQYLPPPIIPEPEPVYDFEATEPRTYTIKMAPGSSLEMKAIDLFIQSPK